MTVSDKDLEAAMADLMTAAPPTLADGVLVEVGMVDRYARFDAPIGRSWSPGTGSASRRSRPRPTTPRSRPATWLGPVGGRCRPGALPGRPRATRSGGGSAGDRRVRIDLDLRGHTEFERDVWHKALEIPRGEVRPYGWIAAEIGRPKAVRAVGTALGHNPVPLIVPCHRVVRTDGSIGQYSLGGPENKRTILAAEGLDPEAMEAAARAGLRYLGSDTTHVVCLPTCHHARRITGPHRVPFRSLQAAAAARLPALPGLPARVRSAARPDRCWTPTARRPRVHSCLGPSVYANAPRPTRSRRSPIWIGLLILYVVWGSTYLGIAIAIDTIPPFLMAATRFLIAGAVLVGWSIAREGRCARPSVTRANGATARSSAPCCWAAGWAWSRSASRRSRPGSPPC